MPITGRNVMTAEDLLHAPGLGRCELLRGELITMSPAGSEHGWVIMNVAVPLGVFVKERGLARVFGAETGFQIAHDPDTVLPPDVAFVDARRMGERPDKGFFQGPPDLAVEVVSPGDRPGEVLAKVRRWLEAGCRAVWVIDPGPRTVAVYRSRDECVTLDTSDELSGEEVVQDFQMPVAKVFAE